MRSSLLASVLLFATASLALSNNGAGHRANGTVKTKKAAKRQLISPGVGWNGYGGDSQHSALWIHGTLPLRSVRWSTSIDGDRAYYGSEVIAHYAAPCISQNNTVIHSFRYDSGSASAPDYDNWEVIGQAGSTGAKLWQALTDYSAPSVFPNGWTSVYPMSLTGSSTIVMAGGGGTVLTRSADAAGSSPVTRFSFYSSLANYSASPAQFANIKICTPITGDVQGDMWFGYAVVGSVPSSVATLGAGGFVHISPNMQATFTTVAALGVNGELIRPALNAAPALSKDGLHLYASVCDGGQATAYLVELNASTLQLQHSVHLVDPAVDEGVLTIDQSTASPMVGPDGHVFYGVFAYYWRESHGWMLQFDANLNPNNSAGKKWPTGGFGWDDTPSVVPSYCVPSYHGKATYLILTKYNNYRINTGDGVNKVAVLDPSSDSITRDRQQGIPIMNEILTVVGPTPDADLRSPQYPNAVCEWCINSAAVDVLSKSAIINSEDGHVYRWSFISNTLAQGVDLTAATGEAYTSTAIGPDGTLYAINNTLLWAVGAAPNILTNAPIKNP